MTVRLGKTIVAESVGDVMRKGKWGVIMPGKRVLFVGFSGAVATATCGCLNHNLHTHVCVRSPKSQVCLRQPQLVNIE